MSLAESVEVRLCYHSAVADNVAGAAIRRGWWRGRDSPQYG